MFKYGRQRTTLQNCQYPISAISTGELVTILSRNQRVAIKRGHSHLCWMKGHGNIEEARAMGWIMRGNRIFR